MALANTCKLLKSEGRVQALQACAYCDPVWNAIQAEALAESENE